MSGESEPGYPRWIERCEVVDENCEGASQCSRFRRGHVSERVLFAKPIAPLGYEQQEVGNITA